MSWIGLQFVIVALPNHPHLLFVFKLESLMSHRLDSAVGRASAFGSGGNGFEFTAAPYQRFRNCTSSCLADARIKWFLL